MSRVYGALLAGLLVLAGCTGENMNDTKNSSESFTPFSAAEVERLSNLRIFFGHRSVGQNILDGILRLQTTVPGLRISIVDSPASGAYDRPVLGHSKIGRNTDPESKFAAYRRLLDSGIGAKADVAFMKLCYVDFESGTDAGALFASYQTTMDSLSHRYPKLKRVHWTVPLTAYPSGIKQRISRLIGRRVPEDARNRNRNRYNTLLRAHYGKSGFLFDLAAIESGAIQGQNGCTAVQLGDTCQTLCPEYTSDGGHLNDTGAERVAQALLRFLANLQ